LATSCFGYQNDWPYFKQQAVYARDEKIMWMKDDKFLKIVLFGKPSCTKQKAGHPWFGWEDVIKKDLMEIGTSWEGARMEALNRLG